LSQHDYNWAYPGRHDGLARDRAKSQTIPLFYRKIVFRIDVMFLGYCRFIGFLLFPALIPAFWTSSEILMFVLVFF